MTGPAGARVEPGPGPSFAPADRPGTAFDGGPCLAYSFDPRAADANSVPIASVDHVVGARDEVRVAIFPEWGATADDVPDATGSYVGVRVRFDDGTTTGEELVDQYGIAAGPVAQGDSATLPPFQWSLKRFSLARWAGRRASAVELVCGTGAEGQGSAGRATGWVEFCGIAPASRLPAHPIDQVDTRRGTRSAAALSRGNTVPIVCRPHGGVFAVPVTDASRDDWLYTWSAHADPSGAVGLEALAVSSIPSPWVGERGALQVFPVARDGSSGRRERRRTFQHSREIARPHEYSVDFDDGSRAAALAGAHSVEFTFSDPAGISTLVIDLQGDQGAIAQRRTPGGRLAVVARVDGASRASHGAPARFAWIECDAEPRGLRFEGEPRPNTRGLLELHAPATTVRVRIGVSYLGVSQARAHLEREMPWTTTSEAVRRATGQEWEPYLTTLELTGASDAERVSLVSSLARMHVYPNDVGETLPGGRVVHVDSVTPPPGPDRAFRTSRRVRGGPAVVNNGFWDTYRTVWPWFALRDPEEAARLFDGMMAHGRDGGWMPRWSAPGYVDAMVGTNSDVVAATILGAHPAWAGAEAAYDLAVRNATVPPSESAVGRRGLARSRFRGWVDDAIPESVSWTMEGAVCDSAIVDMAVALRDRDPCGPRADEFAADALYFGQRARDYVHLFDADTGFFRGRDEHGRMRDGFDPRRWGGDYTETNAWGMAFSAPHDPEGLAGLFGGRVGLGRALDAFFATPETGSKRWRGSYPTVIHEMVEARNVRMGMFGLSNQPAHHIPFLYAATDRPWRTQQIVSAAVRTRFTGSEIGQGYPGDEDNGELSAWLVLSALGLYPLMPGGDFVLTSPLLPRVRLRRPAGDIVVQADGDSRRHHFIAGVMIDGDVWESPYVPQCLLADGASIVVTLGDRPTGWGRQGDAPLPPPVPRRDLTATGRADGVPGAHALLDDSGETMVRLTRGDVCAVSLAEYERASVYTVTMATPGAYRWRVTVETRSGSVSREVQAEWDIADRTRPFVVPTDEAIHRLTIEAIDDAGLRLTQLELLAADVNVDIRAGVR